MAETTLQELRVIANGLRGKMLGGIDMLMTNAIQAADRAHPALRMEMVVSAAVKTMAIAHREIAAASGMEFTPNPDHVMASAIVLARYISKPAIQQQFDIVSAWAEALADVAKMRAPANDPGAAQ